MGSDRERAPPRHCREARPHLRLLRHEFTQEPTQTDGLAAEGLAQARISFDDPQFHRRELTVFASRNSCNDFPGIIRMIEDGRIDTAPWITIRMGLADVPSQFPLLRQQPNLVKAMIEVRDTDT